MPHTLYLAPCVEITELICVLNVLSSAIFVITFTEYSVWFTPSMSLTQIGYSFCGRTLTMVRDYVTTSYTDILLRATKKNRVCYLFNFHCDLSAFHTNYLYSPFFQWYLLFCSFSCIKYLYCNIYSMYQ